jgi:hypothetical protein
MVNSPATNPGPDRERFWAHVLCWSDFVHIATDLAPGRWVRLREQIMDIKTLKENCFDMIGRPHTHCVAGYHCAPTTSQSVGISIGYFAAPCDQHKALDPNERGGSLRFQSARSCAD